MKNITTAIRLIALVIAFLASSVRAQETGTINLTGTFTSDSGDHTWSLRIYGTTHSHPHYSGTSDFFTDVNGTAFDLSFTGPDADYLNQVVSEQFAGGSVSLWLRNHYESGNNWSMMGLSVTSPDQSADFWVGHEMIPNLGLFPSDADGYPIVTPEPYQLWTEDTYISWYGWFFEMGDLPNAEISGSVGSEEQPLLPTLSIGDSSVMEGNRGTSKMQFTVSRSGSSEGTVSVSYRTVDGTARSKSDYTAASGTLTFAPGVASQTITISVKGDRTREPNETFTVELFNVSGGTIGDGVATGTILNDD